MKRRATLSLTMAAITLTVAAYADEALDTELIDTGFLEYLATYEMIDGEWVDPVEFAEGLEQLTQTQRQATDSTSDTSPNHTTIVNSGSTNEGREYE